MTSWLDPPPPDRAAIERLRHCYVLDAGERVPALLLEWREAAAGGWEGRVVRPVLEDGQWRPREEWISADRLESV